MRRPQGEDGSVLVLVLGLTAVLLVLVGVVVDVSATVLARRSLASVADGAAVTAAQQLDVGVFYERGTGEAVPLSEAQVRAVVAEYAAGASLDQPGLELSATVEGDAAVVTARRVVRLPLAGLVGLASVDVGAVARARSPVQP